MVRQAPLRGRGNRARTETRGGAAVTAGAGMPGYDPVRPRGGRPGRAGPGTRWAEDRPVPGSRARPSDFRCRAPSGTGRGSSPGALEERGECGSRAGVEDRPARVAASAALQERGRQPGRGRAGGLAEDGPGSGVPERCAGVGVRPPAEGKRGADPAGAGGLRNAATRGGAGTGPPAAPGAAPGGSAGRRRAGEVRCAEAGLCCGFRKRVTPHSADIRPRGGGGGSFAWAGPCGRRTTGGGTGLRTGPPGFDAVRPRGAGRSWRGPGRSPA